MKLWFATGNAHKRNELAAILKGHQLSIPSDKNIHFDPVEDGSTFLENALIKARALYDIVQEPVIADDSGLCVDALSGRPGIYSARYGSENGQKISDAERNALLLKEVGLKEPRSARFVCAMVLLLSHDRFFIAQETLEGELIQEERGSGGFGYDPVLYLPEKDLCVAELDEDEKNRLSHRGKAGRRIAAILAAL